MGNCQAIDTATLVIQHPCGRSEKLYWPVSANEIMKMNPGHYVALLISTTFCPPETASSAAGTGAAAAGSAASAGNSVRVTRIKLLRPTDTLILGQVYRLITAQEVMKVLSAKKYAKMKKGQAEEKLMSSGLEIRAPRRSDTKRTENLQVAKHERHRHQHQHQQQKTTSGSANSASTPRPRTWQPSLHSISEGGS